MTRSAASCQPSQRSSITPERITEPGFTRFEKALILEAFFRDGDNFIYSTDVSTGHSSLDLEAWLLNPESENFRTGYCEQFAGSFASAGTSGSLNKRWWIPLMCWSAQPNGG